jgi:hypothetical protein
MFWNIIPNEERLRLWKKLRDSIAGISIEEQLLEIAKFCFNIPYGTRTIDYYTPDSWPTPWEVLFYGEFCTSSISLLMFYTLQLLENSPDVELYLIDDSEDVYLLPVINNHFVLNYELGKVSILSEITDGFKVLKKYSQEQVKTIT